VALSKGLLANQEVRKAKASSDTGTERQESISELINQVII
jgi:hypothetical protein